MAFLSFGVLNFVHSFSSNNTVIFSTYGFHCCFFREQDVILRHCILPDFFCLTAQNNPVVIDLGYLYGSTLESNHNTRPAISQAASFFALSPHISPTGSSSPTRLIFPLDSFLYGAQPLLGLIH